MPSAQFPPSCNLANSWRACDYLYRSLAASLIPSVHLFIYGGLSFAVAPIRTRASRSLYISCVVCTRLSLSVPRSLSLPLRVPLYIGLPLVLGVPTRAPSRALSFSPCTSVYPVASRSRSLPYGSEPRVALTSLLRSACDCLVGPSLPFSSSPCTSFYPLASRARSLPSGLRLLVAFIYLSSSSSSREGEQCFRYTPHPQLSIRIFSRPPGIR